MIMTCALLISVQMENASIHKYLVMTRMLALLILVVLHLDVHTLREIVMTIMLALMTVVINILDALLNLMSTVMIRTNVRQMDAMQTQDVIITKFLAMITVLALQTPVTQVLVVFIPQFLVMMITNVPKIHAAQFTDASMTILYVMITICVPLMLVTKN
jgi:hypothetical protein